MNLRDGLQHAADVLHVIEIDDRVVDRADHLHRVLLEDLAAAKLGHRLEVTQLREHRLYVAVCLEQPINDDTTRNIRYDINYTLKD